LAGSSPLRRTIHIRASPQPCRQLCENCSAFYFVNRYRTQRLNRRALSNQAARRKACPDTNLML